jgi:hypothetical protein
MILKSGKVFSSVQTAAIVLLLVSSLLAQTEPERNRTQQSPPQEAQRPEADQKAAKEIEKKALDLIDELVAEAASLRLAENRVHILTTAADILWPRNEERARALAREAIDQVVSQMREAKEKTAQEDGQYFDSRYPRRFTAPYIHQTVLNLLARRDAKLALEFLQLMRSLRPGGASRDLGEEQQEKMMEMNLASQIAENDPQTALRIAEDYLDENLDYQAVNLWSTLQRKDPKAASALTDKIIGAIKSKDILSDYNASGFVFTVLSVLRSQAVEIENARNNPNAVNAPQINSADMQQAYRDALEVVAAATLKITVNGLINQDDANRSRNLLMQIPNYLPDIDKFLPSRGAAVRAKIAQFDKAKFGSPYEKFYAEYGNDLQTKSLQELLALAPQAPQEVRQNVYYQAVHKAIEQGDDETARKIIKENIPDKWQANDLLSNIERRNSERAIGEGKYADARKSLARMRTDEQRATTLAGWASAAAGRGDEKSAREMLDEARALIGSRMQSGDQLEAQISVAAAAVNLNPDLSFEIADAAIERINRLVAANMELQIFSGMEEGETRMTEGGAWGGYSGNILPLLITLAHKDFDRAASLLKHWQPNELRLMMSISIAQSILSEQGIGSGFESRFTSGQAGVRGSIQPLRSIVAPVKRK